MQPPTEHIPTVPRRPPHGPHGDEDELYRRHHRDLQRAVAHVVRAPRELIEDACQTAWAILMRCQPDRYAIFGWLRIVAIHEAYRLSAIDRRDARLERLRYYDGNWREITADPRSLEDAVEALEALHIVASLPERQRRDFVLKIGGYSYEEIRLLTPGRTMTNSTSRWSRLARASAMLTLIARTRHDDRDTTGAPRGWLGSRSTQRRSTDQRRPRRR